MSEWGQMSTWLRGLAEPVTYVLRSDERIYWPFVLSAVLLAGSVLGIQKARDPDLSLRRVLRLDALAGDSVQFELRFMLVRALLSVALLGGWSVSAAHLGVLTKTWIGRHGATLGLEPPYILSLVCISVGAFVAEDFVRFWVHVAFHRSKVLWQLHQVHHAAERLSPLTIYRTHPIEGLIMQSSSAVTLGVSAGVLAGLLDARLAFWEIGGVSALSYLWNLTGANLRHSPVWLAYPVWLEKWLISPAAHQLHHSRNPADFDRNFGAVFSIWDRAFGSLLLSKDASPPDFGIASHERNHTESVASAMLDPVMAGLRVALSSQRRAVGVIPASEEPKL